MSIRPGSCDVHPGRTQLSAAISGLCFVMTPPCGPSTFLHLSLEHMPNAALELVPSSSLLVAERRPVIVVEVFDDLEGPTSFDDVSADQFLLQFVCDVAVTGVPQFVDGIPEE